MMYHISSELMFVTKGTNIEVTKKTLSEGKEKFD